tara:strand:+ start:564 stop:2174 length:1611 start_codon:yes stop_codon:yes gene_type:complete
MKFFDLLNKRSKKRRVGFFGDKGKAYVMIEGEGNETAGVSKNGFDFEKTSDKKKRLKGKWERIKKKRLVEDMVYKNAVASGSEWMNREKLKINGVIRKTDYNLVFFSFEKEKGVCEVGALATESSDSGRVKWRGMEPVWTSPPDWKEKEVKMAGLIGFKNKYLAYWRVRGQGVVVISYPKYKIDKNIKIRQSFYMKKPAKNPLIKPEVKNSWEAFTTFNPAAIYEADKVHILYRAQGMDYVSVLGYANSRNGVDIDERLGQPVYIPSKPFEKRDKQKPVTVDFISGGGQEGCEDPRITRIEDRVYLTYVAFNGWDPPRIALSSIKLTDFLAKRWLWERPILISPPGVVDKSACILPEKVKGKYVIFHRIFPNILVDFVDSLDFSEGQYLKGEHKIKPRSPMWWDSRKIGVGAPPLKTKDGWLLIYQAVDDKDSGHYSVGAMMLSANDPSKELYRGRYPIIEPNEWYENDGFKAGVVYPCGAVIINNQLMVYYGGADSHVCVATADVDQFLEQLKSGKDVKLEGTSLGVVNDNKRKR